jgi:hypothetical protein
MKAEIGVLWLQIKEQQQQSEAGRSKELIFLYSLWR